MLHIEHVNVAVGEKVILPDFSYTFLPERTYVLMGPNGSGKSTLAQAILGHPQYSLGRRGKLQLGKKNLKPLAVDERARLGLFLSFQTPLELPGVTVFELLRLALEKQMTPVELHRAVEALAKELDIRPDLLRRSLNVGFSGGERKKLEALQAALLKPKVAFFDEIDTGVDVDALKKITRFLHKHLPQTTTRVFITHSPKMVRSMRPDIVLVLKQGSLVAEGGLELAHAVEKHGFDQFTPAPALPKPGRKRRAA